MLADMRQPRVRLIHWNVAEIAARVAQLRAAGYAVNPKPVRSPAELKVLAANPPAAVVIDLSRTPSHGRDVALAIRARKGSRHVPLVFVEGDPAKVAPIRKLLPDGIYTTWAGIRPALIRARTAKRPAPAAPQSVLAGYSGTPLPRKLGIKPGSLLVLVDAPPGTVSIIGTLPPGARLRRGLGAQPALTLWFVSKRAALESRIAAVARRSAGLWVAWPKRTSGVATDLTQAVVREIGLAAGLVDFKICALDQTWSALRFSPRVEVLNAKPAPQKEKASRNVPRGLH